MGKRISLSLCIIVKDEEMTLDRCLSSVKSFIDEIILVDTGSTDNTKEIAKKFNAKIYDFEWINDFAAARNYSFSKATSDYIMWLDADDYIREESIREIETFLETFDELWDYVSVEYALARTKSGEINFSLRRNRIIKRERGFKWIGIVHEYLEVFGVGVLGDFVIDHGKVKAHTDRNLRIFRDTEKINRELSPRDIFYYGNELRDNMLYSEAINKYKEFISCEKGWIEDVKTAYIKLIECLDKVGRKEEVCDIAFDSFKVDVPRAEVCCALGYNFFEKENYNQAAYWYLAAFECIPEKGNPGVSSSDYYTIIPALQLSICYYKMSKLNASYFFHKVAESFYPKSEIVMANVKYFNEEFSKLGLIKPIIEEPINVYNYRKYL